MAWALGFLSLGAAVYFGSRLGAQPSTRPAASTQTRIAMLNLRWVIKNYAKYQSFIEEIKTAEKTYVSQITEKQKQYESKAKDIEKMAPADRERAEQDLRNIQREVEDIKLKARKDVSQRSNDQMVKVYKEVRDAAFRHAQANGFDLVLHFEGPAETGEVDSPMLVTRNMNAGGCVPLYWNPSLDISGHVLKALNAAYSPSAGTK
jgi:Skp family chaperone for outer membrane proteins